MTVTDGDPKPLPQIIPDGLRLSASSLQRRGGLIRSVSTHHMGQQRVSIAQIVLDCTRDGYDLVDRLVAITGRATARDRDVIDACKLLLAYAWGQPVATTEIVGPGGGPVQVEQVRQLTEEQLEALIEAGRVYRARRLEAERNEMVPLATGADADTRSPADDTRNLGAGVVSELT